jgi:hypothetical protein
MMTVVSCTRTTNLEGYSSIQAVVQLANDGKMQDVKDNVRLHFTFLREPQHASDDGAKDDEVVYEDAEDYFIDESSECDEGDDDNGTSYGKDTNKTTKRKHSDDASSKQQSKKAKRSNGASTDANDDMDVAGTEETDDEICDNEGNDKDNATFKPKTIITYRVDYSVDYSKMQQLFGVDIYALGEHPSVEEAIPMIGGEDDDVSANDQGSDGGSDQGGAKVTTGESDKNKSSKDTEFEEVEMSDEEASESGSKKEGEGGNGDRFGVFVDPEQICAFLDRANVNYFLLTFPLYEHEWDVSGFLLSSLFDVDDEDASDDDNDDDDDDEEDGSDKLCCLPCN